MSLLLLFSDTARPTVTGTPQAFTFNNASGGLTLTYTGGGATGTTTYDVLLVNSNTTVSTPSGWTLETSRVGGQGAYVFSRQNGTGSVVLTTSGDHHTIATWVRVTNTGGVDTGATSTAGVDGSSGSSTPSLTTPALAGTSELAIAFAALHSGVGATPTYTWSSGYTERLNANQGGTASDAVGASVATKASAGTAAETPSVSWTPGSPADRYILFLAFSPVASGTTHNATATLAGTGALTATATVDRPGTSTLGGTGTLTATSTLSTSTTSTLAGTGALTATAAVDRPGTTTLAGAGALTATAAVDRPATVTLAGTGTLTATGTVSGTNPTGTLDGTGALTATATKTAVATSTLAGTGTLAAAAAVTRPGTAILAGTGALTATATVTPPVGVTSAPTRALATGARPAVLATTTQPQTLATGTSPLS